MKKHVSILMAILMMMMMMMTVCSGCIQQPYGGEGSDSAGEQQESDIQRPESESEAPKAQKTVKTYDTYSILLYQNSLDTTTPRLNKCIIGAVETIDETNGRKKEITVLGNTYDCTHIATQKSISWIHDKHHYKYRSPDTGFLHFISLDSQTGQLMRYSKTGTGVDREYKSEVNEYSSEEEFTAYAKKLISQHCSVEGCRVEIKTDGYEYDEKSGNYHLRYTKEGYVNNQNNVSDFYANYTFTFYKTISGIRRYDTNTIIINNTGEVDVIDIMMQEELHEPFLGVKVDIEQANKLTRETLSRFVPVASENIECDPRLVATSEGELWLQMNAYASWAGITGSYEYFIKVAELEDETSDVTADGVNVTTGTPYIATDGDARNAGEAGEAFLWGSF